MFENEEKKLSLEEEITAAENKLAELKKRKNEELEAEKEAAKLSRKEEAEDVKAVIMSRLEGEIAARKAKKAAYEEYLKICDSENEKVAKLCKAEHEKLNAFIEKHPEGYHTTIKLGNMEYYYDYSGNSLVDSFEKLFNMFSF